MVAGELTFAVGYKSHLMGFEGSNKVHQLVKWIAFNIELAVWPFFHQFGQLNHIRSTNVPLIWPRMNGDALCAGFQAHLRSLQDTGNTQVTRISKQRHLVDVHRQGRFGMMGHEGLTNFEYRSSFVGSLKCRHRNGN